MQLKVTGLFKKRQEYSNYSRGFTLIEVVVGIAIFAILLSGVMAAYSALSNSVRIGREKVVIASLSADYLEIVRNMPYSDIGTANGNPSGVLPDCTNSCANARTATIEGKTYKIYYEVTYVHDPADPLVGNPTYKQVKMFIKNTATNQITTFLTTVSPKGLITNATTGAISIQAINANGDPVPNASVHIENLSITPNIVLDRTTDATGLWTEVGLPASVNGYHVVVTKSGYSTDQTLPITAQNPNPTKPNATVRNAQVTQVSFGIDLTSMLLVKTLDQACQSVSGTNVNVSGTKLNGTNPNVLKYSQNFSSANGLITINPLEWDVYTPTLLTGQIVMVYGTSPIQQITVLPGTTQTFTLILGPATANSLLVIVKDSATGSALEGAVVHLHEGSATPQDFYGTTGGSVWTQTDWSGGQGQADWTVKNRYYSDDGNIDTTAVPSGVRLKKTGNSYVASGWLESSTYDTGAASNFTTLTWQPSSQSATATAKFQVASNNDNTTWVYKGPDGTANTYYTVSGTTINSVHDGDRYLRYKAFLSTTDIATTPVLTSAAANYVSGCYTPGQVMYANLTANSSYSLDVALTGYTTKTVTPLNINGNQVLEVLMNP